MPSIDEFLAAGAPDVPPEGRSMEDPHLFSVDELRAAGALDVPPAWRKSLSARLAHVQRDLFSDLADDEEPHPDDQAPSPPDEDDDEDAAVDDLP